MTQLQFIPLKTPEGRLCGHARVAGGFVELQLRADAPGRAAELTAAGVTEGPVGSRFAVLGAPVQAGAVLEAGRIRCLGLARGVSLTPEQVRARLMTPRRADAEGAARMETVAARALARAAAQGEAARAAATDERYSSRSRSVQTPCAAAKSAVLPLSASMCISEPAQR